jgi:predicted nucleic acid-binding protein
MRVYIDTSVVGGVFDEEFLEASRAFFAMADSGGIVLVVSDLLQTELVLAPERVRNYFARFKGSQIEEVRVTDEAFDLADLYIAEKVVGATSLADCHHIATTTIHRVDVLVSWNFKHIVNLTRIRGYNSVNLKHGYPMLEIRTPLEVIE